MTSWAPALQGRSGPLYRAIADALAADIEEGRLSPGTRLPTHRELAERVGVTVGKCVPVAVGVGLGGKVPSLNQ